MVAEIHALNGDKIEAAIPAVTPLSVLEDLVKNLKSGEEPMPYEIIILTSVDMGKGNCEYASYSNDLNRSQVIVRLAVESYLTVKANFPEG